MIYRSTWQEYKRIIAKVSQIAMEWENKTHMQMHVSSTHTQTHTRCISRHACTTIDFRFNSQSHSLALYVWQKEKPWKKKREKERMKCNKRSWGVESLTVVLWEPDSWWCCVISGLQRYFRSITSKHYFSKHAGVHPSLAIRYRVHKTISMP